MADGLDTAARPRRLVPTDRETRLGATRENGDAPVATTSQRRGRSAPRGQRERKARGSWIRDLDPRSIGGPKAPLLLLGLSNLLASWDDTALRILLPEMRADFAFSLQFLLTLGSILGVVAVLLGPAMGYLADRIRRVAMLRVGALLANVASIVQGAAQGIPMLVGGRALGGFGSAVREPAGFPLLTDYYPSRSRARVFAFLGFMGGLGGIVGPVVAGNLGEWYGWRVAVVSLGILATIVTIGLFFLKEPPRGYQDRLEMGAGDAVAVEEQRPVSWGEAWRAAASITTVRRLWYATPFLQVAAVGMSLFLTLYYAEEFGLGPQARGYIATAQGIAALVGVAVAAPIADRILAYRPGRVMVALGALMMLYALSVVGLVLSHNLVFSVIVGLPLSFGFVAIGPALYTLMSLVIPARIRGLGIQTIAPWQLLGLVLLPFIGRAADTWSLREGLLLFIPIYLIGAIILASSTTGVDRDIRAARAASMADEAVRQARSEGRTKLLVCRDVDVHYGGTQVLFNLDLDVEDGEMIALVGTNGAGKSTLLRAIAGVQQASNGAIFLEGREITYVPPHEAAAEGVVYVPGGQGVFANLSVRDNMRAAAWLYRDDPAHVAAATERAFELFPVLRERQRQRAGSLSGGEQQMLTLAQAFLARPRLLMIDELSLGLAPAVVDQLLETLRRINAQGTTIILVEQSLNVALRVARRAVFMEKGEIRFDGPTEELFRRPELVRSIFMGRAASSAGRLPGSAAATTTATATAPARAQRVLQVEDVSVRFGGIQALAGVTLDLGAQEIVGLIGPNGAGKSTLFDVISGFVAPDSGKVLLKAKSLDGLTPDARARLGLGRSFQDTRLFPSLTVRENLAIARDKRIEVANPALAAVWAPQVREAEQRVARRVEGLLELFGLESVADKFVDELSTGTRRAVDLACITAAEPEVLLLDEPSAGLAHAETAQLGLLLARIARETRAAVLVIDHDMALLSSLCDRLVAMALGSVITTGDPPDVLAHPRVVSAYLASSSAVSIDGGREVDDVVHETIFGPSSAANPNAIDHKGDHHHA